MPTRKPVLLNFILAGALLTTSSQAFAQASHEGPEDFRIELTGAAWLTGPTGSITADGTPINFVSDLAVGAQQPRFFGRLVLKPGRKQRIVLEGTPASFSGVNTIERSFVYLNRVFNISQTVKSNADINYAYLGYQYDPLTGRWGHLGFGIGAAYLAVDGTLIGVQSNLTESKALHGFLPLPGADFRVFPIPASKLLEVEGTLRGLAVGSYGYYVEGMASGGIRVSSITFLAGYREMFANLHEDGGRGNGVVLHLKGPIFSLQWRW